MKIDVGRIPVYNSLGRGQRLLSHEMWSRHLSGEAIPYPIFIHTHSTFAPVCENPVPSRYGGQVCFDIRGTKIPISPSPEMLGFGSHRPRTLR